MSTNFLRRPIPYWQESLSSYIHRIAFENGYPVEWILKKMGINVPKKYKNINCISNFTIFHKISGLTGLSLDEVINLTMNKYSEGLWKIEKPVRIKPWNMNPYVDIYHREVGCKYCPLCLNEIGYHRLYWHLVQIEICLKHKTILIDSCKNCNKNTSIEEIIEGYCRDCGENLRYAKPEYCNNLMAVNSQKKVYMAYGIEANDDHFNIEKANYLKIFNLLELLIGNYKELDCIKGCISSAKILDKKIQYLVCIEKFFENWPGNLFLLFDEINEFINQDMHNNFHYYDEHTFSPIRCIREYYYYSKVIPEVTWQYFLKHFNVDFFARRINRDKSSYIDVNEARTIFGFSKDLLEELNIMPKQDFVREIDLNVIIGFLMKFIRTDNLLIDERGFINLLKMYSVFKSLDISLVDIIDLIFRENIDIKIDPYRTGLDMVFMEEKIVRRKLLELSLRRIE